MWKAELIAAAGATVIAVDPQPCAELEALAVDPPAGRIVLERRAWSPADLIGAALVIGATDDEAEAARRDGRKGESSLRIGCGAKTGVSENHGQAARRLAIGGHQVAGERAGGTGGADHHEFSGAIAARGESRVAQQSGERFLRLVAALQRRGVHGFEIVEGIQYLDLSLLREGEQRLVRGLGRQVKVDRRGGGDNAERAGETGKQPAKRGEG